MERRQLRLFRLAISRQGRLCNNVTKIENKDFWAKKDRLCICIAGQWFYGFNDQPASIAQASSTVLAFSFLMSAMISANCSGVR